MADKRIADFATLSDADDDDLLLVSSESETYNIKVKTIKDAVQGNAVRAEAQQIRQPIKLILLQRAPQQQKVALILRLQKWAPSKRN